MTRVLRHLVPSARRLGSCDSVEAHEQGFRASDRFGRCRAAIGPFFASPPVVEHVYDI